MMKRARLQARIAALLFPLALFATPLHLTLEAHEWHHDASHEDHRRESDQGGHPVVDHEVAATSGKFRFALPSLEIALVETSPSEPEPTTWVPLVEPESNAAPEQASSPPRSPRAPPL